MRGAGLRHLRWPATGGLPVRRTALRLGAGAGAVLRDLPPPGGPRRAPKSSRTRPKRGETEPNHGFFHVFSWLSMVFSWCSRPSRLPTRGLPARERWHLRPERHGGRGAQVRGAQEAAAALSGARGAQDLLGAPRTAQGGLRSSSNGQESMGFDGFRGRLGAEKALKWLARSW